MRPTKEFPAAREHFRETSTLELFPRLIFAMRYLKLSPQLNHARATRIFRNGCAVNFHFALQQSDWQDHLRGE